MATEPEALRDVALAEARRLGFHRVGIVPVEPPRRFEVYRDWLDAGYAGEMAYMASPAHVAGRRDLRALAAGARAVIVVALAYAPGAARPDDGALRGFVARYARGRDYHEVMKERLRALADALARASGRPVAARPCVDTAPVLERDLAERAGLGFVAKNTMLIAPGLGSYTVLGELLVDVELAPTAPDDALPKKRCGSCTACLDACPTGAFADPYVLDARRCISYLTIEHRGAIPRALRHAIGEMIFGCDICQEVCPFNAAAPERTAADSELTGVDERAAPDLLALLALSASQRRRYLAGTAMNRASRATLYRNVCIALGNRGDARAVPALAARLDGDPSAVVRGAAAWALGELGAIEPLARAAAAETDPDVSEEIRLARLRAAERATARS